MSALIDSTRSRKVLWRKKDYSAGFSFTSLFCGRNTSHLIFIVPATSGSHFSTFQHIKKHSLMLGQCEIICKFYD